MFPKRIHSFCAIVLLAVALIMVVPMQGDACLEESDAYCFGQYEEAYCRMDWFGEDPPAMCSLIAEVDSGNCTYLEYVWMCDDGDHGEGTITTSRDYCVCQIQ